ncbi:MAG: Maf family protein [Proteobacteria bacterium]|nr:Maf family protein [Pseudomonadota bacterium]MDA0983091.1 Maf family protein [Pseudomonadota bacterium]
MTRPAERSIYLASRSSRRRDLLTQIGVRFQLLLFRADPEPDPDLDETVLRGETPAVYVKRVARAKAEAGWARLERRNLPRAPVLSADTTVALQSRILGKPGNRQEAAEMLAALSGRRHEVLTAVALKYDTHLEVALSESEVQFCELDTEAIREYLATGEADDKAGSYGIQGRAARYVVDIRGSHSGIVGLPLYETAQLIERLSGLRERRNTR